MLSERRLLESCVRTERLWLSVASLLAGSVSADQLGEMAFKGVLSSLLISCLFLVTISDD